MASLADAVTKVTREGLQAGIRDARLKIDPIFKDFVQDNVSAVRGAQGRSWEVLHTFVVSNAGAFRVYGDSNGGNIVYGETPDAPLYHTAVSYDDNTPRAFPGITEFVAPNFVHRTIGLKQWTGNIFLPHQILRSDRLTAAIGKVVEKTIQGVSRNLAQHRANLFFSRDTTNRAIGTVGTVVSGGTTNDTSATFTLAAGRIRRFQPGMLVDIWNAAGTTRRNGACPLVVHSVDVLAGTVRVDHTQKSSGTFIKFASQINSGTSGDIIVLRNSKAMGPSGLKSWIKNTGSIFGLQLSQVPQFKSMIIDNLGSVLTDAALNKYFGGFCDSMGAEAEPDVLLTTQGVVNGYVGELDDLRVFSVNGTPLNYQGGFSDYGYVYDGRRKSFRVSSLIDSGYLYGLKVKNNIIRYTPPALPGAGSNGQVGGELEFVAPVGGINGIWAHVRNSDGEITDFVQAPFTFHEEYAPEIPQSLEIGGITEVIATS